MKWHVSLSRDIRCFISFEMHQGALICCVTVFAAQTLLQKYYFTFIVMSGKLPGALSGQGGMEHTPVWQCLAVSFSERQNKHTPGTNAEVKQGGLSESPHLGLRSPTSALMTRVGQNHIYTVFWQENHQIYIHIRCIYTILANPTYDNAHQPIFLFFFPSFF